MDCIHQLWDDNSSQASDEPEYVFVEAAPDHMPSSEELARRNRRRARNREAANRHEKVGKLENGIGNLKLDGTKLREENVSLKAEIEQLKFQLQWKHTSTPKTQQKNDCSSTTGWSCWKSTSFSQKCLRLPVKHFEDLGKNRFYSSINKACA